MKKFKLLLVVLSLVLVTAALVACGGNGVNAPDNTGGEAGGEGDVGEQYIYFGVNYELTGAFPIIGESAQQGIDMAVDEINAAGGITIDGESYMLAYKALDNAFNTDESAINAQELADDDEIVAMVGPNDSDMAMAAQAIVTEEEIVAISPWSTLVVLTESPWFFRACFTDDFQGEILAKYAYEYEDTTTAAVLYDMSNPYNEGIATRFREVYEQLGGTVVEYQSYNGKTGETDFTSQLTKIAAAEPDILLLPNFYEEIIAQTTQARDMGYTGKFMGSDTWGDTSLLEWDTENLLEGALWVGHYHKDVASDVALEFIDNYHTIYGTDKDPNDIVALNYDAVYLLKTAIENAQSFERAAIRDGLNAIEVFEGVTGTMNFIKGNGDPTKSAVINQISGGEFKYLDTVVP
ncbi:MAG: ABC transporter substrate-binding protein [Anaerolineales bacterium]|jgi:branched-chain amino acid transport system substrate-binding protein